MNCDTVLFDLDGTLTDSAPGILHSIRIALEKLKRPIPDEATLNRFIGPPLVESFRKYCGLTHAGAEQALVRVLGAKENGIGTIGVPYGYGDEAELRGAGARVLAATPAEVVKLILGDGGGGWRC